MAVIHTCHMSIIHHFMELEWERHTLFSLQILRIRNESLERNLLLGCIEKIAT